MSSCQAPLSGKHVKNGKFSLTEEGRESMSGWSTITTRGGNRISLLLAISTCALLLTACAGTGKTKHHPVEERAQERWDALLKGDFDTAYTFYSPGYRSANSRVDFEISYRTRKVAIYQAMVQGSDCSAEACTVSTEVGYRVGSPVPGVSKWDSTSILQERWVKTEGKWWFVPEE
jgi:hypothetical protein